MSEPERDEWLRKHLATLPAEITPGRDLWPDIARRIRAPARPRWPAAAIAASLVIGVAAGWLAMRIGDPVPAAQPVAAAAVPVPGQLAAPWEPTRERFARDWPGIRGQIGPETAAVIEQNLEVIRKANAEIAGALEREPENPALRRLLQQTLAKEIDVYHRAWDISRHVAMRGDQSTPTNWRGNLL